MLVGTENEALQEKVWHNIVSSLVKDVPESKNVLFNIGTAAGP